MNSLDRKLAQPPKVTFIHTETGAWVQKNPQAAQELGIDDPLKFKIGSLATEVIEIPATAAVALQYTNPSLPEALRNRLGEIRSSFMHRIGETVETHLLPWSIKILLMNANIAAQQSWEKPAPVEKALKFAEEAKAIILKNPGLMTAKEYYQTHFPDIRKVMTEAQNEI